MAHFRRFRTALDRCRQTASYRGSDGRGSGPQPLCARFDHHRPLSRLVSVGEISPAQGCGEDAHAAGPARQYPHVYQHYRRQSARRQHPRRHPARGRCVLRDGPRLHRLRAPLLVHSFLGLLRGPHQRERSSAAPLLPFGRQVCRLAVRSQVVLTAIESAKAYPDALRRVSYFDAETNQRLGFLTNNFALPALTITQIYKCRWQVELFFKWIKQHLRIKAFFGTSENAVKTQIWIAVSVYVLVAIVRKRLELDSSLYQILQILSLTLFEKTPILQALQASDSNDDLLGASNQLILFDF